MLFCRFCGTQLEKDNDVCPACGKNNNFKKPAKQVNKKKVVTILVALLLAAVLAVGIFFGIKWILRINRPNDLYYKDNYTVSAEQLAKHRDTVVATYGDYTLTNGLLQVFYWGRVYEFMDYVGNYASYYGVNYALPLSEQVFDQETGKTWEQMFLEQAVLDWQNYVLMVTEAKEQNFTLTKAQQEALDSLKAELEKSLGTTYKTVDEYLSANICPGCTFEDYEAYNKLYFTANAYFSELTDSWEVTAEELDTFYSENAEILKTNYKVDKESGNLISVRHILVQITGGTEDEDGAKVYSDEDWEKCRQKAQEILDKWLAGEKTEDSFAALADELTEDPGSKGNGGLYTGINKDSSLVKPFLNWCIDETRKVGDYGLVKTSYGYHVMFFSESELGWVLYCTSGVQTEKSEAWIAEKCKDAAIEINYKVIKIVEKALI